MSDDWCESSSSCLRRHLLPLLAICTFTWIFGGNAKKNVQAPVSDREYRATLPETAAMIDLASTMISEGRGSELLPSEADPGAPITAYRWVYTHIIIVRSNKYEIELFITIFWDNIYLEGIGFKM